MWTRTLLKTNAKNVLRRSYWRVFLVCLLGALLTGSLSINYHLESESVASYAVPSNTMASLLVDVLLPLGVVLGTLLILAIMLVWNILISPVIQVGWFRYMMENRAGEPSVGILFDGFRSNYWSIVQGMFYSNVRIFLYTLLLVVPGVIKSYQYYFVPYLLAENPNLTPARAAELSSLMTEGEKWNIFVLNLSFIGWRLLGSLLFGVGNLFVEPYCQATYAELYAAMRAKALASGYTDAQELPDFFRR